MQSINIQILTKRNNLFNSQRLINAPKYYNPARPTHKHSEIFCKKYEKQ